VSPYHHGDLRGELIRAAVELGRTKGAEGIVMRELARQVGVSPNAAYRHFSDRDDLLREVGSASLAELSAAMHARMATIQEADPKEFSRRCLREIGKGYVGYALAEQRLFAVGMERASLHELNEPIRDLTAALDACLETGFIDATKRPGAELACWAAVHGFALLYGTGPLRMMTAEQRDIDLDLLLDRVENSLRS